MQNCLQKNLIELKQCFLENIEDENNMKYCLQIEMLNSILYDKCSLDESFKIV